MQTYHKAFARLLSRLLEKAADPILKNWLNSRSDLLKEVILKTIKPWTRHGQGLQRIPGAVQKIKSLDPSPGRKTIVFCVPRIYIQHINHSTGLRTLGHKTILITNWPLTTYGPPLQQAERAFDYVFCSGYDNFVLFELLTQIQADLLYTVDYMKNNWFCLLAKILFAGPTILEIYDLADNVGYPKEFSEKIVANSFGTKLDLIENEARELLYSRVDGLVFKEGKLAEKRLFSKFKIKCPSLRFYPYFSSQTWQGKDRPKLSDQDGQLHIVHTGFIPPPDPKAGRHLHHCLLDLADKFSQAQVHFHIYNPLDLDLGPLPEFEHLTARFPFFHYHRPLFIWDLPQELSQYDLGWMVYDFSDRPPGCNERYQVAFCSRILTYIAAGLPVLVSREFGNMADFVEKNNIGQTITFSQVPDLDKLLSALDMPRLSARTRIFREELALENKIAQLDDLITQATHTENQL